MAYQINLTGKEIDERLQNVGTAEDVAAADGTLYARISKNADDISTLQKAVGDNVRIDALDNGDASASFVAGRNLKVNGWEFYWKDVWEESEPSAIKHIESAGVNAAINEIKGTGADVSAFTFPTTKDEFIAYLKTITFDFSNQPNQVSGYGSVTYGIMNKNAGTTTIVEGMLNAVPNKIHRSHIEGQHMTFPDVEYALDCHVEGQDCNIVGYASICHLEGTGSAVVHSMRENVGFFSEAVGCHVEGGDGVAGGAYSHVEGSGCAALNFGAHCEGRGYYKNSVTDWKKRTAKDNDYLKDLWKKILFGKTDTSGYTYKFSAAIGHASHVEGMSNLTPTCSVTLEGLDEGTTASFVNGANHAEGAGNLAGAVASHAEGIRNEIGDDAYASHAEGIKNTTQNRAEHASGQYNKSNKATDTFGDAGNTLFSVGCGTSDADRKNAFEVMQDGTCKYYDVDTGEQIDVGVAKELSKPFDLTIGSTTKKVDGKSTVTFSAEEFTDKFNGVLIQKLTTASTEADIRKAFTEVNTKTVLFPTPGSVITKLNGNNKGIVVSLSEPDATTLGRSIVVYYGDGTYTIVVKNDFTKVLVPWTEIHGSKKIYDGTLLSILGDTTDEAEIKKAFTPKGYAQPVIPDTGDIARDVEDSIIFSSVQEDEFYIYVFSPQYVNFTTVVQCNKNFTKVGVVRSALRMYEYQYNGGALLDTKITTPSDIKLLYTPVDTFLGYSSAYGAEPPKIGDTVYMPTKTSESSIKGIVVDAVETNNTYITRWFCGGKLYEAEVTKDFNSIPKYGKVIYDTTSGTLRDLYISAGAKYNEATGCYELNGLTDITEEEMRAIYTQWQKDVGTASHNTGWLTLPPNMRTNLPSIYRADLISALSNSIGGSSVEVLCIAEQSNDTRVMYVASTQAVAQNNMPKLRRVIGVWRYNDNNPSNFNFSYGQPFGKCPLLEEIRMMRINKSHTFAVSPNLSKESVLYMITNANPPSGAAAGSIAITLHPTAYARLKDDADIVAALEAKGGIVTLVSA